MPPTLDTVISNNYPGVDYDALESTANSLYHEDREITSATSSLSFMYRVVNAEFDKISTWNLKTPSGHAAQFAYATVQDPFGSIHYYQSPPTVPGGSTPALSWGIDDWIGSGNNTVYNAVDFGLLAGSGFASNNTTALQNAVDAAVADASTRGAVVFIPAGTWYLKGAINIPSETTMGLVIAGSTGGTQLIQTETDAIFLVTDWENGWGLRFRDLRLTYNAGFGGGKYAITIASGSGSSVENATCERVYFENCPGAFSTDNRALQCGMVDCTVDYNNTVINQTAISLSGSQDFVRGCVIRQSEGGPTGCTAIRVASVGTFFASDNQISAFATGIEITAGAVGVFFNNVRVESDVRAVYFNPAGGNIYNVLFSNCSFNCSSDTPTESGILVDTGGGSNTDVSGVLFSNCISYGWGNAGLQINSGSNIVVIGGQYSGNGQDTTGSGPLAGIAVTGGADVTITGVDCTGKSQWGGGTQAYGISVSTGGNAIISNCNLTGNTAAALLASSPGTLEITNCAGYNDQGTVIAYTIVNNTPFGGATVGYYGPMVLYAIGGSLTNTITEIDINSHITHLTSGTFTVAPGAANSVTVKFSGSPNFLLIGV